MGNVCNLKGRLLIGSPLQYTRTSRHSSLLQLGRNQLRFYCSILIFFNPLGSFPVKIPRGDAYGPSQQVLAFCVLWAPCTMPLASEAPSGIERRGRPNDCRRKGLRNKQTGSSHPQDFDAEDGMSGIVLTTASLR